MQAPDPTTVLVFGGGSAPTALDQARLPRQALVIAADSGGDHALGIGRRVDVFVGDLDSISDAGLETVRASGATIERHPADKDASDLELALHRAMLEQPTRLVVTAVGGGRIDHLLANLALASSEAFAEVELDIVSGSDRLFVVRGHRSFDVEVGQLVSLLPMHGAAQGVVTSGLRYPLAGEPLEPGSTRGLSNLAVATTISVEVAQGTLLAVMPDQTEPDQTEPDQIGEER